MITGILLAAGKGQRFGRDKRLEPLASGTPIAIQSLRNLAASVDRVVAVVSNSCDPLLELVANEQCHSLICQEASKGMGETLAYTIREECNADGWLVALADMPYIKPESYQTVTAALRQGALISRPRYKRQPGHPVGFSKEFYSELSKLSGDQGARQFLGAYSEEIQYIESDDPAVVIDIDQPQDIIT